MRTQGAFHYSGREGTGVRRRIWLSRLYGWAIVALGVLAAAHTSENITYGGSWLTLLIVVLLLSLLNMLLKPLLVIFTLPFIVLTFGLGIWLINAFLLLVVSWIIPGFEVASFLSALWGALIISVTSFVATVLFGKPNPHHPTRVMRNFNGSPRRRTKDDVIDI